MSSQSHATFTLALLALLLATLSEALIIGQSQQQQGLNQAYSRPQPPAAARAPEERVLDRFNHRYPDGSYEYRYELADGTARYERGYFALINDVKTLMVVGYYSYRMPDARYITVFYNADQYGYRQNQSITPQVYPNLPRRIDMPDVADADRHQQHQQQQQQQQQHYTSSQSKTSAAAVTSKPYATPTTRKSHY